MTHRKHDGVLIALALLSGLSVGVAAFSASLIPPLESGLPSHREGAASRPEGAGIPRIGPEEAAALALNDLSETAEGVRLRHPRYRAKFTEAGVWVEPRRGALRWQWRLEEVTGAGTPLEGVPVGAVRPHAWRGREGTQVRYPRGAVLEQYVVGQASLEQQFVLAEPLPLRGAELVVRGRIESEGRFERTERGGRWRTERSEVTLGEVRVFDATGAQLPATCEVTAGATHLAVDGPALAGAVLSRDHRPRDLAPTTFGSATWGPMATCSLAPLTRPSPTTA